VLWLSDGWQTVGLYCLVSVFFSAVTFLFFKIQDGMARYFSVHDALNVCKAAILAELLTGVVLFSLIRLEGIPRSTPVIHALILAAGLIAARTLIRIMPDEENMRATRENAVPESVIMIGSTSFSAIYIKLLHVCARDQRRVIAVLDRTPEMLGRTIEGVRVVGAPEQLDSIIDEYSLHGIEIDRVIVGGEPDFLPHEEMQNVHRICESRQIGLDFVPQLVGLSELKAKSDGFAVQADYAAPFPIPAYFRLKRIIDFCIALTSIIILLPLFIGVGVVAFMDVGSPILFWQQRLGVRGSRFLLYKFRTMRPPFDWRGNAILPSQQLSRLGRLLRETSLDELPQLLNVLVGDMSLIGPRPLLPEDQPANSAVRLLVRPGITGWAQVNGGKLITAEEKEKLDEWYIRNASIWLDLRIVLKTIQIVLASARRSSAPTVRDSDAQERALLGGWFRIRRP
jgi:lipopolysaccharide/colanic/teichoic acid biosynthesis glycosyltransferase